MTDVTLFCYPSCQSFGCSANALLPSKKVKIDNKINFIIVVVVIAKLSNVNFATL